MILINFQNTCIIFKINILYDYMLNLITISNNTLLETANNHIHNTFDELVNKYNYKYIDISLLYKNNINEYLMKTYNKLPDNILVFKGSSTIYSFNTDNKIKISSIIDDVHQTCKLKRNRNLSLKKITNVFATYAYIFPKIYKGNYNLHFFPHSCGFINVDFNDDPDNTILLSGRINKNIYPNRYAFLQLSMKTKYKNKIVRFKPNVNYRMPKNKNTDNLIFGEK